MADFSNSTPEPEQQQTSTTTSSNNIFFIPVIFSFSSQSTTDPNQETNRSSDQVVMMMMMIPPSLKDGPLPASKASIEAMRKMEITEKDQELVGDEECSICLNGWKIGEEVKEMPCKHRYHSNCIEKWLRIHGSCPVCRFKMPIDDQEEKQEIGTMELSEEETRFVMNLLGLLMQSNNNNQEH